MVDIFKNLVMAVSVVVLVFVGVPILVYLGVMFGRFAWERAGDFFDLKYKQNIKKDSKNGKKEEKEEG